MFDVNNLDNFQANSSIHCVNMMNAAPLHILVVKCSSLQKGVSNSSVEMFNPSHQAH